MTPGVLALVDREGLVFWPHSHVVMVREELCGRLEVLSAEGEIAWHPGPLEALEVAPFVRVAPGTLVNPVHVTVDEDHLGLPHGWRVPGTMPPLVPPTAVPDDPEVPMVGVRASEVLYLEVNRRTCTWWTDRGPLEPPGPRKKGMKGRAQAALHPGLVAAGRDWFVNPRRLRWMRPEHTASTHSFRLGFDNGATVRVGHRGGTLLAANLGLPSPYLPAPETEAQAGLRFIGLRSWPFRVAEAPADFLRREFAGDPERLVATLAAQTVEARRLGLPVADGEGHRPWFYRPARGALYRAGHLDLADPGPPSPGESSREAWLGCLDALREPLPRAQVRPLAALPMDDDAAWNLVCRTLARLVGELRAFTYRAMKFRDAKPEWRRLGTRLPHVVVLVEKESLWEIALELHRRYGVTVVLAGGVPVLVGTEYLVEDLRAAGVSRVIIVSFCDWDPVGWDMPLVFAEQFDRYGLPGAEVRRLVTPDRFTPEELRRLAVPLALQGRQWRSRVRRWVRETGGVGGRAMALYADHLLPLARVLRAFEDVAGDLLRGAG